jgi:crotonobetainyl-CoA:carnitine CoA-transferase CaiB-like acyl-CoA transferase
MTMKTKLLEGTRIIDLTIFLAGPLPSAIMADLGAEVIKVEAIQRLDGFRAYGTPSLAAEEAAYERSPLFNSANRNKRGITLNLATLDGVDLFKRLAAKSDAVVTNFSPRVLPQFGLQYRVLRECNPALVLTSVSGFGQDGPWRDYVSFAAIGEALSGITSLCGYTNEGLVLNGIGVSDFYTGLMAAFGTLAAIREARETGHGRHVDVAQLEASIPFIADAFMDFSLNGRCRTAATNHDPGRAPHGCFPARGEDAWITISVGSEAQWKALAEVMGAPQWAWEEPFTTPLGRYRNRQRLHDLVAKWTTAQDKEELGKELQRRGVPAAPVRTPAEQLKDPQLRATGFFQSVDHKYAGRHPYPSLPIRIDGFYPPIDRVGPLLGEDNHYVFTELLGMDEAELKRLENAGVIGNRPASQ